MTKPLVADHRVEIRGYLQETAAVQFQDAEIDACLNDALAILSLYEPCLLTLNKTGLLVTAKTIDLTTDCPASAVTEIIPTGAAPMVDFRARGSVLLLTNQLGATSCDVVYRDRWKHDGTNTDFYPQHLRGAVTMLAAGFAMNGRARELSETAAQYMANTATMQIAAAALIDYALLIVQGGKISRL